CPVGRLAAAPGPQRRRVESAPEGLGPELSAIWLSDAARHAADRRLGAERQANVSDLSGGRSPATPQTSEKVDPATRADGGTDAGQRALVSRLRFRSAGQWPPLPHLQHRRRLFPRMR